MGFKLLVAAFCILANGFFVATEFGLVKVRVTQLEALAKRGEKRAQSALDITNKLDAYLSASQLGITLASLALGWVGEPALAELIAPVFGWFGITAEAVIHGVSFTLAFFAITMLHIVLGEQAPKLFAIQRAEAVVLWVARPMRMFYVVAWPFLSVLNELSNLALRLVGVPTMNHMEGALSAEEIRLVVASGKIEERQRQLMERVLQGTDRPVRAVMVPRVDMETVSLLDTPRQVVERLKVAGYSRVPVIEGRDPDKVVGYVYLKDLFLGDGVPRGGIKALRRDVLFVPENRTVGDVLEDMQRTHIPLAIVVDEYGGTSGLVTMEDILEEIVGELQDELDAEPQKIDKQDDGAIVVDGMVPICDLEQYGIEAEPIEGHELLAGHITSKLGRLARPGDIVHIGTHDATVEDVRARRVTRVRLVPRPKEPERGQSVRPPPVEEPVESEGKATENDD